MANRRARRASRAKGLIQEQEVAAEVANAKRVAGITRDLRATASGLVAAFGAAIGGWYSRHRQVTTINEIFAHLFFAGLAFGAVAIAIAWFLVEVLRRYHG